MKKAIQLFDHPDGKIFLRTRKNEDSAYERTQKHVEIIQVQDIVHDVEKEPLAWAAGSDNSCLFWKRWPTTRHPELLYNAVLQQMTIRKTVVYLKHNTAMALKLTDTEINQYWILRAGGLIPFVRGLFEESRSHDVLSSDSSHTSSKFATFWRITLISMWW